GFARRLDGYPGAPNVRIVRLDCGGERFLPKIALWPHIGTEWLPNAVAFYAEEGTRPDLVTAHYADSGLAAALWRARGGPPFTFTAHSLGAQKLERLLAGEAGSLAELDARFHFARRIAAERVAMAGAARVVTSTRQERFEQYAHPAYAGAADPADDGKFAHIPPGVNLAVFDADVRSAQEERAVERVERALARDLAPDRRDLPVVVCSSRLEVKKNHVGLVRAFAASEALRSAANLLLVVHDAEGLRAGPRLSAVERRLLAQITATLEAHDLWGAVASVSLERQGELAAAYRGLSGRHSVFALPALYEPFGLAPLEAMAAGLPVVATRRGGPSETLRDAEGGEYGVLVDPSDPQDIARGLLRLVGPGNEWARFATAGRRRVLERYTWERTAEGYATLARALAEGAALAGGAEAIPSYFTEPRADNDPGLEALAGAFA
ncbi:MAG: glycosyltransferase family 1 protein, partial [Gammaproteobacteria bacterium]|nr:glycosyltransferase family 1 protein [Gammaproteobacteria bacterium]